MPDTPQDSRAELIRTLNHDDGCYWVQAYWNGKKVSQNDCNCMEVHRSLKVIDAYVAEQVRIEKLNVLRGLPSKAPYVLPDGTIVTVSHVRDSLLTPPDGDKE